MFNFLTGWFGIRKDFSQFLLSICPFLQEYANIAYSSGQSSDNNERGESSSHQLTITKDKNHKKCDINKPVVPIVSIEMPDWVVVKVTHIIFTTQEISCKWKQIIGKCTLTHKSSNLFFYQSNIICNKNCGR